MEKKPETKSEENVRYVSTGAPTGWAAMARTMRDVDEEKIRDYKEDIDTLLVFAGLFSAVLTAFLLESFQTLSENQTTTMVSLIRQMSSQTHSYTISNGLINSTAPLPSLYAKNEFVPLTADICNNVLWFSSLMISLMAASFGILVKQWLREYLAGEYTSPLARLRVRQFRNPGLTDWKVFEIAAILPLLLQLALGLFFLGLCFFTSNVHPSIANTTRILAGGWAFLFTLVAIAPIFSPRCPYKIVLLKSAMRAIRQLLSRHQMFRRLYGKTFPGSLNTMRLDLRPGTSSEKTQPPMLFEDEDAVHDDQNDTTILTTVDSIMLDDDLLATIMWDSLQQNQTSPEQIIQFVINALRHRQIHILYEGGLRGFPDLKQLGRRSWNAVADITARAVIGAVDANSSALSMTWPAWMVDAVFILMSVSKYPLPSEGIKALTQLLTSNATMKLFVKIMANQAQLGPAMLVYILTCLRRVLQEMDGNNIRLFLHELLTTCICADHSHSNIEEIMLHQDIPPSVVHAILNIAMDCFRKLLVIGNWKPWAVWARLVTMSAHIPPEATREVEDLLRTFIMMEPFAMGAILFAIELKKPELLSMSVREPAAKTTIGRVFLYADPVSKGDILKRLTRVAEQYRLGIFDKFNTTVSAVKFCHLVVHLLQLSVQSELDSMGEGSMTYQAGSHLSLPFREQWQALFAELVLAFQKFATVHPLASVSEPHRTKQAEIAEECLCQIEVLDDCLRGFSNAAHPNVPLTLACGDANDLGYAQWLASFKQQESIFPETLFKELIAYLPAESDGPERAVLRLKYVRRIRQLTQVEESA
ncbi:hypothetical protein PHLCEN_2v7410 [Hermanssonia centrifuga]|uniref:DUF6535 domain-containing protein n=1 Tax=Hermanssonia centrifuga TaxID=98765 RepID=A0A2R6NWL6_9APHY|nr:hypothetical protein PHLCEN_2v7410 [Hermanssonia centrifuga]